MTRTQPQNQTLVLRRVVAGALAVAWLLAGSFHAQSQGALTSDVKAGFLYNFARFTEWPEDAFSSTASPLMIGVAGDEVLRRSLDNVIRGKMAGTRMLKTRLVKDPSDAVDIQMLYVGGASASRAQEFIKAVSSTPVLTVGDVDRFCEKGGMINFVISDNRVRFEIRFDATELSRLKVSSQVITLAKTIYGKS
jgi:hypothetical protein